MIPNIYDYKHYRFYILIPVALLLISLYFIPKIQLDSSLKGGVSVQLVTNSTIDPRTLTTEVNAKIPNAQAQRVHLSGRALCDNGGKLEPLGRRDIPSGVLQRIRQLYSMEP